MLAPAGTALVQIVCPTCDTPTWRSQTIPTSCGVRICPACALAIAVGQAAAALSGWAAGLTGPAGLPPGWLSVLHAVVDGEEFLTARQAAEIGTWL